MSLADSFNELEPKQKVTLVVTIVLALLVVYYGYDTFFGGSTAPSRPSPAVTTATQPPPAQPVTPIRVPPATTTATQLASVPHHPNGIQQVQPEQPTPEQLALIKESQVLQRNYLTLVNKFQIAQLQQKLEAANAAIANSKLKTATTMVKTEKLADQLKQQKQQLTTTQTDPDKAKHTQTVASYKRVQVVYVGEKRGKWMAMMNLDGSYFEVRVGTRLPDGTVVDLINEKGVVLEKDYKKRYFRVPRSLD